MRFLTLAALIDFLVKMFHPKQNGSFFNSFRQPWLEAEAEGSRHLSRFLNQLAA